MAHCASSDPWFQAPLKLGTEVVYFGARGVISNVGRGLHERLAIDCVGAR